MSTNDKPSARSVLHTPRFWLAPVIVVVLLMSALAALYMGGILDPKKHLDEFPIALVNEDVGGTLPGTDPTAVKNFGNDIATALENGSIPRRSTYNRSVSSNRNRDSTPERSTAPSSSPATSLNKR